MNCPRCQSEIDDDSKFCKHCGATILVDGASPAAPADAARPASPTNVAKPAAASGGRTAKAPDVYRDPQAEKQVWVGRPAWRSYWNLWLLWFVGSIVCVIASYRWAGGSSALFRAVLLVVVGVAVAILVREALLVLSLRYRLTTQRLFVHRGILSRITDQMELMRVDDVRLRQSLFDRIADTGDVEIIGSDATDQNMVLESVRGPAEVAEAVRLHVRGARSKGTLLVENI